jgi:hypothetical protein
MLWRIYVHFAGTPFIQPRLATSAVCRASRQADRPTGRQLHTAQSSNLESEGTFEICFLFELPMRGLPVQMKSFGRYIMPNNNTHIAF